MTFTKWLAFVGGAALTIGVVLGFLPMHDASAAPCGSAFAPKDHFLSTVTCAAATGDRRTLALVLILGGAVVGVAAGLRLLAAHDNRDGSS